MTANQLKYFVTVAECLNFTEAGKRHFISQTAITQQIQSLEQQLNTKLFIRSKRHVELTQAGEVFYREARTILEQMRIAVERTEKAAAGIFGNINIGYVKGCEGTNLNSLIKAFYAENVNVSFEFLRDNYLDLLLKVEQGKLDFAFNICYENTDLSKFEYKKLASYPLYAALYPHHPYARLSSIRRYDLRNENFLLTKFYEDPTATGYLVPEKYADSGFIPKVVGSSPDPETLLIMVAAGMGITILPEHTIHSKEPHSGVVFVPLEGEHEHIDVIGVWKKDNPNPVLHKLIEFIDENESVYF